MSTPLPEREALVATAQSLFAHSYSFRTASSISVPIDDLVYAALAGFSFVHQSPAASPSRNCFARALEAIRSIGRESPGMQEELA
ncbi:MAG TPA: hypothetical protein VJS11_04900 [Acidobacteriaceae bacterium]|nr:hypothetical protein [Acidobacteriaceae bacterium]